MKKLIAVGAALAASVSLNVWNQLPNASPSKPAYVQRVEQLLVATNAGKWKEACDAAPTAAYRYDDFLQLALSYGITNYAQLTTMCQELLQGATTKTDGKTPLGLEWQILYWSPDDKTAGERLVIVNVKWNGRPATTVSFHVQLTRIAWAKATAKCGPKKTPCAPLRWFVLGAT